MSASYRDRCQKAACLAFVTAVCMNCAEATSAPRPWFESDGGNGHYYELVTPRQGITWTGAKTAAEAANLFGVDGHLVTITSQEEWQYITTSFEHNGIWIGLTDRIVEGQFEWITGEPVSFEAWSRHEPNNAGDEDYVDIELSGEGWGWNDFRDQTNLWSAEYPLGYIIEYPLLHPVGDFNDDNVLDVADVDMLTAQTLSGHYNPIFDLSADGALDFNDREAWVEQARFTSFGDTNLDGLFSSDDFISVLAAGQYEDDIESNSTWATGDWNGDFEFGTLDLLVALQSGGYERRPRPAILAHAVPEPMASLAMAVGLFVVMGQWRCSYRRS